MKRIRNPDTGRFHTPREAFDALMEAGCLVDVDLEGTVLDNGKEAAILELVLGPTVDIDHPAVRIFRAAIRHTDEEGPRTFSATWLKGRVGYDYYVPTNNRSVEEFARLWKPVEQLHQ